MPLAGRSAYILACAVALGAASGAASTNSRDIKLPPETAVLTASPLPGYQIAAQKCSICHSVDYITLQPPAMSLKQWTGEVAKMQHAYGAPLDDSEIKPLAVYLTAAYGDATSVPAADMTVTGTVPAAAGIDVQALLDKNACLSCHTRDKPLVGPSYDDVAAKYRNDPKAEPTLEENIRAGGTNRWGQVPMPAFPNLNAQELKALADFVLGQR
jgi:cytochrome c551/c552